MVYRAARAVGAAPGVEGALQSRRADFTTSRRRKPPYSKQFCADPGSFAIISLGWPSIQPVAQNVLAPPGGESPAAFDWSMLRGAHVFCRSAPGQIVDYETLRARAVELAAAGAASVTLYDGECVAGTWWRAGCERPGGAN